MNKKVALIPVGARRVDAVLLAAILLWALAANAGQEKRVPWQLTQLVVRGTNAPGTGGQFLDFGEAFWSTSGMLAFWARFGPGKKDWALYSLKNGSIRKVLQDDVEFTEPDMIKKKVSRNGYAVYAGADMLYVRTGGVRNQSVYAWNGEQFKKVLGPGDQVTVRGAPHTVREAWPMPVGTGGVVIFFETERPTQGWGWTLHDGEKLSPLWAYAKGDPLPGSPTVTIDSYPGMVTFALPSIFMVLEVKGAPFRKALFRITGEKADKIIAVGDPRPGAPNRKVAAIRSLWVSSADIAAIVIEERRGLGQFNAALLYDRGELRTVIGETKELREGGDFNNFDVTDVAFPRADSPVMILSLRRYDGPSYLVFDEDTLPVNFLDLYAFDGTKVTNLPWESLTNMDLAAVKKLGRGVFRLAGTLELSETPAFDGVFVRLPVVKDGQEVIGFVSTASGLTLEPALVLDTDRRRTVVRGGVGGRRLIQATGHGGWLKRTVIQSRVGGRNPREVVVRLSDGFYMAAKKEE